MSISCKILNRICCFLYQRQHHRFLKTCNINKVQTEYLSNLLKKNADTVYGKEYGFSEIKSYKDFIKNVPLTTYEDYKPYIKRAADGEEKVLTAEKIRLFELTSGSASSKKMIPYTESLKREFQSGIKPWLYDIYSNVRGVDSGKSYWSITPITAGKSYTQGNIPIGFEEDAEYFGRIEQKIMRKIFAVDSKVKFSDDIERFYFETSVQLLNCDELTLISVWNPTFLTILCDFMIEHSSELSRKLREARRLSFLTAIKEMRFDKVFPNLKIISCWADGSATDYLEEVKRLFPKVYIQPKGLLATECFVSFPLVNEEGSRLSIYSHFFEFRHIPDGKIVLADALTIGEYELIVTTGGGFYRYCIGDIIEVLQIYPNHPPRIRFKRRSSITSDLFGEKLSEEFVRNVCNYLGIANQFCLLAPEGKQYYFYTTANNITDDVLDQELCESYHYNYCRQLGQLKKVHIVRVSGNPQKSYIHRLSQEGMRIGDIKPSYLSRKNGWSCYFELEEERENRDD